jgi:hypothetical protein
MRYHQTSDVEGCEQMRTTIDLDADVLLAAKEIARRRKTTLGRVVSDLAREALTRETPIDELDQFPLFPVQPDSRPVTLDLVNRLRDESP